MVERNFSIVEAWGSIPHTSNIFVFFPFRMLLIFCIFERIKVPIGASTYLPRVVSTNYTRFLKENAKVVLFCASRSDRLDFSNFAISKFSSQIAFAVVDRNETVCPDQPGISVLAFTNGERAVAARPVLRPIQFTRWCSNFVHGDWFLITQQDELRELFDTPGNFVFAVDLSARPADIESGVTVYGVPAIFFEYFNMSVTAGVYVYRSCDRQLVRVAGDVGKYLHSPLVDVALVNISEREFFGGYIVNEAAENGTAVEVLSKVAQRYPNAYFAVLSGEPARDLVEALNIAYVRPPCLVMIRNGKVSVDSHWIKRGYDIEQFVAEVVAGKQPFNHLSGDSCGPHEVTYDTWNDLVRKVDEDRVVVLTEPERGYGRRMNVSAFMVKDLVKAPKLHVYSYDLSMNECPPGASAAEMPSIYVFPEGETTPVQYDDDSEFRSVLNFITAHAKNKFEIPKLDFNEIEEKITDILIPGLAQFRVPKKEDDSILHDSL